MTDAQLSIVHLNCVLRQRPSHFMRMFTGLPASPGIALGPVFVYRPESLSASLSSTRDVQAELMRFHQALEIAKRQLVDLQRHTESAAGAAAAAIFEAHYMFLEDAALLDAVQERIDAGAGAEAALAVEIEKFASILVNLEDLSMRERAADVRDAGQHVLRALAGAEDHVLANMKSPAVVAAATLAPSDIARMRHSAVLGLALAHGGPTSHSAILARTLGLPAIVGLGEATLRELSTGTEVVLDGQTGQLIVEPDAHTLAEFRARQAHWHVKGATARSGRSCPRGPVTARGLKSPQTLAASKRRTPRWSSAQMGWACCGPSSCFWIVRRYRTKRSSIASIASLQRCWPLGRWSFGRLIWAETNRTRPGAVRRVTFQAGAASAHRSHSRRSSRPSCVPFCARA